MYQLVDHILMREGEPVRFAPTPNLGGALVPEGVVVHDTAGRLDTDTSVSWLCDPRARASAHFVVGRDGAVVQLAHCDRQAWHAGRSAFRGRSGVNRFAIGIEIVNPGRLERVGRNAWRAWYGEVFRADRDMHVRAAATPEHGAGFWMDYTAAQISAVEAICHALVEAYSIGWVVPHWTVSPGRKTDTSPLYPLDQLRSRVFGRRTQDAGCANPAYVTAHVNQRRWPSLHDNVIQVLARDTPVEVIRFGTFDGEGWYLVQAAGPEGCHDGWVNGAYLDHA